MRFPVERFLLLRCGTCKALDSGGRKSWGSISPLFVFCFVCRGCGEGVDRLLGRWISGLALGEWVYG